MATTKLTLSNFSDTLDGNDIVIIDFWAKWCGPCLAFGPIFEKASEKHTDVLFAKVNTEEEQTLAGSLGIRAIPMLMIFRQGILLFAQPGLLPEAALDDLLEQAKALDMDKVRQEIKKKEQEEEATEAEDETEASTAH